VVYLTFRFSVGLRTCILRVELHGGHGPLAHGSDELWGRLHLPVRPHAQQTGRVDVYACVRYFGGAKYEN
jgi:hypothetical protein